MKKIILLGVIITTILLAGCVKILNDELKSKETKLVLNAAISPDSMYTVNVSHTFNIFEDESENNLPFIDSAAVQLFEDGSFVSNLQNTGAGYYINPGFFPQTGKEYKVEVSYGSYPSIESTASIPKVVPIKNFDTLTIQTTDEYEGNHLQFVGNLTYDDPPGEANFYQLSCRIIYVDFNDETHEYEQYIRPTEKNQRFFDGYSIDGLLWSDKLTDGKEVSFEFIYFDSYEYGKKAILYQEQGQFIFYFKSISKAYYTYLKSMHVYSESGGSDNPFSEPVVIYSNVKNGYGIMGGYNQDTTSIKLILFSDGEGGVQ